VLWMEREALAGALNMRDGFNDLTVTLAPHASEQYVIDQLDKLLAAYGSLGAYGRKEQLSHNFLAHELTQIRVTGTFIPAIFLSVVAFLIHNVLHRITSLQRAQIGLLKSFGYTKAAVAWHYLKFSLLTVMAGAIAGIVLGAWLGRGLAGLYTDFYHFPKLEFVLSGFAISIALLSAVLSAAAGAALAIRHILKLPPAEAMRPESPAHFKPGPLERLGLQQFMPLSLRIILRNIERRPLKASLSILGLALAVALMITGQYTFDALDEIIRIQFRIAQREDMTVTFNETRDISVAHNLASLPGVIRVEPFRSVAVRLRHRNYTKKTAIMGLPSPSQLRLVLDEQIRPIQLPEESIVLTKKLAQILGANPGDRITVEFLEGKRKTAVVPVWQVVDEPVGTFAYMAQPSLAKLMDDPEMASGAFLAIDSQMLKELYRQLKNIPLVSSVNLREATLKSFMATVGENMKFNTLALVVFACIITIGIVYNSARIALSEHAVELASLRILGFSKAEVGLLLLGEQALLVLPAIPLGCLIGYGLAGLLSLLLSQELFRIPLVISGRTLLTSICVLLISGIASAYLIWRKVQRLDLIEVLKTRE
jgi:putative ABC transport system permease protein